MDFTFCEPDPIQGMVRDAMQKVVDAQELYIINMMHILDLTVDDLKDYVFEQYPVDTQFYTETESFAEDRYKLMIVQKYRLRRKTDEEKEQERRAARVADDEMYLP